MDRISGSVYGIQQNPAIYQIKKTDINKTLFLILEELRFENFSIIHHISKIAGIRPDIRYSAPTGYPAGNPDFTMAGYPTKLLSDPSLNRKADINFKS